MTRICESEREYRRLEHSGLLKQAIGAYAIGQRSTDILDLLASARAWSYNFEDSVPLPGGYNRTEWNDILDTLVLTRLGDRRCLDCGGFYASTVATKCFIYLNKWGSVTASHPLPEMGVAVDADRCPHCHETATEAIGCVDKEAV